MAKERSLSKTLVWGILALLVLGLGGFGVTNLSGNIRKVGSVGNQDITVDDYVRELRREIRATEAQIGSPLSSDQIRAFGIDQMVLGRLVALASLDDEVASIGLSVGDANVLSELTRIPAFQGVDGKFDRESYRFALEQAGLTEAQFENDLRAETARTLVQGAVVSGSQMPGTFADTLLKYVGERRSFTWSGLTAEDMSDPLPEPTDAELQAYFNDHGDDFRLPETKKITYVLLTPDMLLDQVEVDDDAARQLYDDRADTYRVPERRLVERLAFASDAAAADAKAQLEVGGTTFERLVEDRGLALSDIDLGDVTADDLDAAAEAVFAAETGTVVGPLPSPLGPSLYRVNGVLAPRITSFEDALPELREELSGERARRLIDAQIQPLDDLLAGGATLEELAGETDAELGQIDWSAENFEGIAAYDAFRSAAAALTTDDYPQMDNLEDGGIFAMRLDDTLPERPEPFDSARDQVIAAWTEQTTRAALEDQAAAAVLKLAETGDFAEAGLKIKVENGLTRQSFIDGTAPDFMRQVFEMQPGDVRVIAAGATVQIVRLDAVQAPADTAELRTFRDGIQREVDQALAQALFQAFLADAQRRASPQVDQNALNAVMASFQ